MKLFEFVLSFGYFDLRWFYRWKLVVQLGFCLVLSMEVGFSDGHRLVDLILFFLLFQLRQQVSYDWIS